MGRVRVHCAAPLSATTVLWRAQGELRVSLLVRGDFRFEDGRTAFVRAADLRDVDKATDMQRLRALALMPAGEQTDLLVFAQAQRGDVVSLWDAAEQQPVSVRVALLRNGVPVIDERRQAIVGKAANFGERAPTPARCNLLDALAASTPETIIETPDDAEPSLWQSAPPSRRFDGLQGGEYLMLEYLHPQRTHLSLPLPAVTVHARAQIAGMRLPLDLQPGLLAVDVRRERGTIVWRGHFPVYDEASLATAQLRAVMRRLRPAAPKLSSASSTSSSANDAETATWPRGMGAGSDEADELGAITAERILRLDDASDEELGLQTFEHIEDAKTLDEDTARLLMARPRGPAIPFATKPSALHQPRAIPGAPWSQLQASRVLPPKRGHANTLLLPDMSAAAAPLADEQTADVPAADVPLAEEQTADAQAADAAAMPPKTPDPQDAAQPAQTPEPSEPVSRNDPQLSPQAAEERRKAEARKFEQAQQQARERERIQHPKQRNKAGKAISLFYRTLAPQRASGEVSKDG